jgi:hypothetical protein
MKFLKIFAKHYCGLTALFIIGDIQAHHATEEQRTTDKNKSIAKQLRALPMKTKGRALTAALLIILNTFVVGVTYLQSETMKKQTSTMEKQTAAMEKQTDLLAAQTESMNAQLQVMRETLSEDRASGIQAAEQTATLITANEKPVDASKQSAEVAQETLILGSSASITVKGASLQQYEVGKPIMVVVEFSNEGATSARDVRVKMICELRTTPPPSGFDLPISVFPKGKTTVGSKIAVKTWDITTSPLTQEARNIIEQRRGILYAYGAIIYTDIFKKSHRTSFCLFYKSPVLDLQDCGGEIR